MPWLLFLVVVGVVLVAALLLLNARLGGECRSSGSIAAGIPHRTPVPRLGPHHMWALGAFDYEPWSWLNMPSFAGLEALGGVPALA